MKRIYHSLFFVIGTVLLMGLVTLLIQPTATHVRAVAATQGPVNCLILGLDDAASNADAMLLVQYDPAASRLVCMQIPRDTFRQSENGACKLNGMYPSLVLSGLSEKEALSTMAGTLSRALGIPVHFSCAVRLSALKKLVDDIGGIPLSLPLPVTLRDENGRAIHLPAGNVVLDGTLAAGFVRYRSGYAEADVGRMDAQKRFLFSLLRKLSGAMTPAEMFRMVLTPPQGITVSLHHTNGVNIAALASALIGKRSDTDTVFFTAPGAPLYDDRPPHRTWYYVLNRAACTQLLEQYYRNGAPLGDSFDNSGAFCADTDAFRKIYTAETWDVRVYHGADVNNITIIKKKE